MSAEYLIDEFERIYLDDPDFGEEVVYTAENAVPKTIKSVIYRKGHAQQRQVGDRGAGSMPMLYDFEIAISRGATNGIEVVTEKTDTVELPLNYGDLIKVKFRIVAIIKQDIAVWYLGLIK